MPMPTNVYTANLNVAMTNTKKTVAQLTASSSVPIQLGKFSLTSSLTAATAQEVQFIRLGSATTSMTSGTVVKRNNLSPSAGTTVGTWVSSQTDGSTVTILWEREIDLRAGAGWDGLPIPESRDVAPVSGVFAIWLAAVLAGTTTLSGEIEWAE